MPALARRRDPDAREQRWRVFYGDVQAGTIGIRAGVPVDADQWAWTCGFYPVSHRGEREAGSARDFFAARADFEAAWQRLFPKVTQADLEEYRRERARTAWKYAMWDAGCRMPTQLPSGRSLCFCGAEIDIAGVDQHVYTAHHGVQRDRMKFVQPRPFADPEAAARKLLEIANAVEAVQDGRIYIEKINAPFLYQLKGTPAEYKAGLDCAIAKGWLWLHESGSYVKFTEAGAQLFA